MEKKIDTSVRTTDETSEETMEETMQRKTVVNHFEAGANCQVFNGNITNCTFSTARRVDEMTARRVDEMTARRIDEMTARRGDEMTARRIDEMTARRGDDEERMLLESEEWTLATSAGLIDEDGQPTVSRPEAALMANMIAERLSISRKWKVFERLWQRKNMRGDYNTALDQRKSLLFQEKLKNIFC